MSTYESREIGTLFRSMYAIGGLVLLAGMGVALFAPKTGPVTTRQTDLQQQYPTNCLDNFIVEYYQSQSNKSSHKIH